MKKNARNVRGEEDERRLMMSDRAIDRRRDLRGAVARDSLSSRLFVFRRNDSALVGNYVRSRAPSSRVIRERMSSITGRTAAGDDETAPRSLAIKRQRVTRTAKVAR